MSTLGHVREVFYGINTTENQIIFQLISTAQLPGVKGYDIHMVMNYATSTKYVSLEFQKHLSNASRKNGVIDQGK